MIKFNIGDIVCQEPTGLPIDNDPMYWLIIGISVDTDMLSCKLVTNYKLSLLNTAKESLKNITVTYDTTFIETHYVRAT
jgi:hypothetical protein